MGAAAAAAAGLLLLDEHGTRLSLLDEATLVPLARREAPCAVAGEPRLPGDGSHAYLPCASGRILKLELPVLKLVAEVQTGEAVRALAVSGDGRWVLAGVAPASVVLFDASLQRVRSWRAETLTGQDRSEVTDVRDNPARRSFVVAFASLRELWEISYDPAAEPIFEGLVHDYRMAEGLASSGFLGARRTPLQAPLKPLALSGQGRVVLGATSGPRPALEALQLDARVRIARVPLAAEPAAAALFTRAGRELLAVGAGLLEIVDPAAGSIVRTLGTGPVLYVAGHPDAPHLWIAVRDAPRTLLLMDRQTLQIGPRLTLEGELLGPPVFTEDGARVLLPVRGAGDALQVYDARAAVPLQRLPTGAAPAAWPVPPALLRPRGQ